MSPATTSTATPTSGTTATVSTAAATAIRRAGPPVRSPRGDRRLGRVFRSQWVLLNRTRVWVIAGSTTVAFTVVATVIGITTAGSEAGGGGLDIEALSGAGGATAAVIWAGAFGSTLLLVTFISAIGNEFTRGTFRTALLHRPGRVSFIAGKVLALLTVTAIVLVTGLVVGWVTAAVVAPGQGIDTAGWFGFDALGAAATDLARLGAWAFGWAVLGTTIGVVVRSTPLALGVGLLWFGPIENIIGDEVELGPRWFPGWLLRAIVMPDSRETVSTSTAAATLAVYLLIALVIVVVVLGRRDVTS